MLILTKKGQTGMIGAVFLFIFFIIIWFIWLGGWVATIGHTVVIFEDGQSWFLFLMDERYHYILKGIF
jgi:hypothetical protein